jgi:carboxylesterase type B
VPPEKWTLLEAKRYKDRAVQKNYIWDWLETGAPISEDCLYLNVISPAGSNDKFPVSIG